MFPPARSAGQPIGDRREFIGRDRELTQIAELLAGPVRLVTLTGPGGIGKTALAVEAMARYAGSSGRPVLWAWLTRLADTADSGMIAEEIVLSTGTTEVAGLSAWDVLVEQFDRLAQAALPQSTVLVIDNCEHVMTGLRSLLDALLRAVPGLTVLATSREAFGLPYEHTIVVPPLARGEAIELFRRRAELTGRPLSTDADLVDTVALICRHIDHNPLFIRLAAARLRHRPPALLLRELDDDRRLRWSDSPRAGVEPRHRVARDVIAWSYRLCTPDERLLLDRMSVFAAGFETDHPCEQGNGVDIAAVDAVCVDERLPGERIAPLLERLAERSLISRHVGVGVVRYYLLENVRVFAAQQLRLRPRDEHAVLNHRHRLHHRDRVVAGKGVNGPGELRWLSWARTAWDDILIAIESSLDDPDDAVTGLETAVVLMSLRVPFVKGANRTFTRLTERALAATRSLDPQAAQLRITATALVGWIALWQGRRADVDRLLDECVAACVSDSRLRRTWRASAGTDIGLPAPVEFTWGMELLLIRLHPDAIIVLRRARAKFHASGDRVGVERSELFESFAQTMLGEPDRALDTARALCERTTDSDSGWTASWGELAWILALARHGDPYRANELGLRALVRHMDNRDSSTASWVVGFRILALARILTARADARASEAELTELAVELAHLIGGVATQRHALGIAGDMVSLLSVETANAAEIAVRILGVEAYRAAEARGAALRPEFDELQHYLLGDLTIEHVSVPHPGRRGSRWVELSSAEREVAILAAAGWPNSAIAQRRGSSIRTVDAQVAAIRQKLLISTRSDITWHVPDSAREELRVETENRPKHGRKRGAATAPGRDGGRRPGR